MKRLVLVGALVGAFAASTAFAQTPADAEKPAPRQARTDQGAGHTAPKAQPATEAAPRRRKARWRSARSASRRA